MSRGLQIWGFHFGILFRVLVPCEANVRGVEKTISIFILFYCWLDATVFSHDVYAVDASDIAAQANEVVKANNLSETVIVLHGRVEDVEINEEVDVIISEWMGYMLLYESMLGSVITARDCCLKPGGLILPSTATLYMAPVTHPDRYGESIDLWRNVYGIDIATTTSIDEGFPVDKSKTGGWVSAALILVIEICERLSTMWIAVTSTRHGIASAKEIQSCSGVRRNETVCIVAFSFYDPLVKSTATGLKDGLKHLSHLASRQN
ncbi:hypothetical protein POM88_029360 [Heracleum sosnowskyi]|uniref:Uncharacterized protein n=1 Tax=Heracleum sosnowskyi TaxID=360622 RepID=A0AAD8HVA5_9APIA|nr:hypothetical protein POM88_029360 [Heracleum sosnowskyi]